MNIRPSLPLALLAGLALAVTAAACGSADGLPSGIVHAAGATASAATLTVAASSAPSATGTAAISPTPSATVQSTPASSPTSSPTLTATPFPSNTPSPTPCADTQGRFSSVSVPSSILHYDIITRIYLPPCYASSGKSYPVLYMMHGLNFDEGQWERMGVGTTADQLIAAGQIAPLIIVLPRDNSDPLLDPAFVVDLVPYVDSNFRTLASPGYRAIGGMSHGGGWSIHLGLRYPNVFGRVGAHSPAIFFGDENNVLRYIRAIARNGSAPALYIDTGAEDNQPQSAIWLDQMFNSFKISHTYLVQPGGHVEAYWEAHLADYLRFYAAAWRP